jgi:hypothetical protein
MKFVYVKGLQGPEPQLWPEVPTNGSGQPREYLQCVELTLDTLKKAFPLITKESTDGAE